MRLEPHGPAKLFDEAARLHAAEIHHGLLPMLGKAFLSRLYRSLSRAPQTGVWVALEGKNVVGFIAGSADPAKAYFSIMLKDSIPLFSAVGKALFSTLVFKKVPSIITYLVGSRPHQLPCQTEVPPKADLLAIAVDAKNRGRGTGRLLVETFEKQLKAWNTRGYYRVATNQAETGSNAFYRAIGFEKYGTMPHHELMLQIYKKKIP